MAPYPTDRGLTADYHYAVEQALRYRRPKAVLIDEAQHLFTLASGRRIEDQLNVLKSLANRSNTVHVLCGTYELLRARNLSGQLSRRSIDIHFPRYDIGEASDRRIFAKILQTFAAQMPFAQPPDLINSWEYLYERSIGCVGILKDWLARALATAMRCSAPTLTLKHLEKHALSVSQCDRLIEEAARGESQLHEDADARGQLRLRLGFPEPTHLEKRPNAKSRSPTAGISRTTIPEAGRRRCTTGPRCRPPGLTSNDGISWNRSADRACLTRSCPVGWVHRLSRALPAT